MGEKKTVRSSRPYFPTEDIESLVCDVATALEEGLLRNGRNLRLFEAMFAECVGVRNAVAFDSDQSALEAALQHFGIGGKEVAVCTNSFISVPNSVVYAGGKPVFVDICGDTLSMNPDSLAEAVSKETAGVIVTHIAGFPNPSLPEIMDLCRERGLFLIEDATHATGAVFRGRKVGQFGDAAVFAFTPTKVITTGEGGMLVTQDHELAEEAQRIRYYGSGKGKTCFASLGRHMMMPEISAILGVYQLRRLNEFLDCRNAIAKIYDRELGGSADFEVIECSSDCLCSYYKYPVKIGLGISKEKLVNWLDMECRIETGNVFYPPCHMQPVYQKLADSCTRADLNTAEEVLARTITLPMHVALTQEDARYVAGSLKSFAAMSRAK